MDLFSDLEQFEERIALIFDEECLSYGDLQREIDSLKPYYDRRELAFCIASNTIASVEVYLSLLQARIPVVLIDNNIAPKQLQVLIGTYSPYYIWMPEGYMEKPRVCVHRGYSLTICRGNESGLDIHKELALLLTTSGSTASPKLVRQSYKNIQANTESIVQYLKIRKEDCTITTLPMHYTYGLSILQSHLLCGATIVLTEATVIQPEFWALIRKYQVTTFGGVPYTYEMLNKIRFLERDIASLRYLTQAGGRLGKEMHLGMATACAEKGIDFIVMYGQTEATARMSYVPAEYTVEKAGSIGIAIPGGSFWLENSEGEKIEIPETTGELVYQGENVTMGYAECKDDLKKGYEQENILHTGDMARFDKDGYYYVVGRKKRFLKIFGARVNLDEVEEMLQKEEIDSVVLGTDDHMKIFVLDEEARRSAQDFMLKHTTIPKFGFSIHITKKIPRNAAGKVLYSVLENM